MQGKNIKSKILLFHSLYLVFILASGCGERKAGRVTMETEVASKNHKPARALKLSTTLYRLATSDRREAFAREHDIDLIQGRVRVYIFLDPDSSDSVREKLISKHDLITEKKGDDLLRALAPIDELIGLSKEPPVRAVTLPDKPYIQKQRMKSHEFQRN